MPKTPAFHSVNEEKKAIERRVYHDNSSCRPGQDIPLHERRPGMNGYSECESCNRLNSQSG
jgi:hypothetical protein